MPKQRIREKGKARAQAVNVQNKFRIGTRSAGKAAHKMSTTELREVLTTDSKSKYHHLARTVLRARNAALVEL